MAEQTPQYEEYVDSFPPEIVEAAKKARQEREAKKAAAQRQDNPDPFFAPATDQRGEPQAKRSFPWRQS